MQYKVPRITSFTGLEGIDKRIQNIQEDMADKLSWLEYSFGLCQRVLSKEGNSVIPVSYVDKTTDQLDLRPWLDDSHKSYSFWDLIDPTGIEYGENFSPRKFPTLTYEVACIIMVDLNSINSNWKVARSLVRQRIYKYFNQTLRFKGTFLMTEFYEKDIEQIFDGYDLEDPLLILRKDTAAFRIEGNITFKLDCSDVPILQSVEVGNVADNIIVLTYNKALDESKDPATTDYTLTGTTTSITGSEVSGLTVRLTLDADIFVHETIYLTYNKGTNPVRDLLENDADEFTNKLVTNNSTTYQTGLWSLPSLDETYQMYVNLAAEGVGGFNTLWYWTSTEFNATIAKKVLMLSGANGEQSKGDSSQVSVRAFRTFIAPSGAFSLRDVGPGGGLVFYIDGTTYYEAYATDQSASHIWSNVNTAIGTTGSAIGDGAQNTLDIIGQAGHTTSAAKLCNDLNP